MDAAPQVGDALLREAGVSERGAGLRAVERGVQARASASWATPVDAGVVRRMSSALVMPACFPQLDARNRSTASVKASLRSPATMWPAPPTST